MASILSPMPIRSELRWLYPIDWRQLSHEVRFRRAKGRCEVCGRPHGQIIACLPDGRWFDAASETWRISRQQRAHPPAPHELANIRTTRVVLAAAHRDHDPTNNRRRNLACLCQRCHMLHDRPHHLRQRRLTYLRRFALGDLFLGPYRWS
jgi:hypothetical protein